MENNIINNKIQKFLFHLNRIGLLREEDNQVFLNNFYEISKNYYNNNNEITTLDLDNQEKYIEENLTKTLCLFLNSLNEEKNKMISLNIYNHYKSEEKNLIKNKLCKLIYLYQKLKTDIFFKKWFLITNNKVKKISLKKDSIEETNLNTISCNISSIKNPFDKRSTYSINNNSYNYSYNNYSPQNKNKINNNDIIVNIKYSNNNSINLTRNHQYNLNSLNNGKLMDYSKSNHNKTTSKIDNTRSYTFTNDYSPLKIKESKNKEKRLNYNIYKNEILSGKDIQLFNKKNNFNTKNKNKISLKLKAHFEYLGKLSKSKKDHKLIPEKTTEYIKEQEEIKNNCTFKPKINKYKTPKSTLKKIQYNNMIRTEQLYLDNQKRMAKKTANIIIRDNKISKENTFQPKFVSSSVKKIKKNFSLRQYNFNKLKEENMNKILNTIETDYNSLCTFSPKLNLSYNNKINYNRNTCNNSNSNNIKIPAYQRLYNDNKEKIIRQEERKNQVMEDILLKANNPLILNKISLNINDSNVNSNSNNINISKSVDYQKIEELYKDYKKKQIKLRQKRQVIDNEKGITFNPLLINGEKYLDKIDPNFFEREKKFVENQRNHIEAYQNYLDKEKEKYFKKFSEDKKTIIKNVVDRLYKDGLEKTLMKNNTKPNIFSKSYNKTTENCDGNGEGNETIYANKSTINMESFKNSSKNKNIFEENKNSNDMIIKRNNIIIPMKNNDDLFISKNIKSNNLVDQLPFVINNKKI